MSAMAGDEGTMVRLQDVAKAFVMHLQGGIRMPVVQNVAFDVRAGECVVLGGPSGIGKSSILKMIYGNYRADDGYILVRDRSDWVDVASVEPRRILNLRRSTVGYVSQFLRTIPRVAAIDVVASAARDSGLARDTALARAKDLLARLNVPERLWALPPATFSGGEQQRVNIARGFAATHPVLLLDEPTASLDEKNRAEVVAIIADRKKQGAAILGIFHDDQVRADVADRIVDVTRFAG